jgi:hypothetical protein
MRCLPGPRPADETEIRQTDVDPSFVYSLIEGSGLREPDFGCQATSHRWEAIQQTPPEDF